MIVTRWAHKSRARTTGGDAVAMFYDAFTEAGARGRPTIGRVDTPFDSRSANNGTGEPGFQTS
jgi:hypothetical protein